MTDMRTLLKIMESNYPENIRQFDHDPRSPFYSEPPEVSDKQIENEGYTLGNNLFDHIFTTDYKGKKVSDETINTRCRSIVRAEHIAQYGPVNHADKNYQLLVDMMKDPKKNAKEIFDTTMFNNISALGFEEKSVKKMQESMEKMVHALLTNNDVDLENNYYSLMEAQEEGGDSLQHISQKIIDNYEPPFDEPDSSY